MVVTTPPRPIKCNLLRAPEENSGNGPARLPRRLKITAHAQGAHGELEEVDPHPSTGRSRNRPSEHQRTKKAMTRPEAAQNVQRSGVDHVVARTDENAVIRPHFQ